MNLKAVWGLLKETFSEWNKDKAERLAAALAYYTVFSLAPLLVIVIAQPGRGVFTMIRSRFLSFTMILGIGFLPRFMPKDTVPELSQMIMQCL